MIDPTTMTDSALRARLDDEIHDAPRLKVAAEYAARQLAENTAVIEALQPEIAFRAAVKELRRKSSAARVAVLRTLSTTERPTNIDGPTEWLVSRKLIRSHHAGLSSRRYTITDLGRRALTLLETA